MMRSQEVILLLLCQGVLAVPFLQCPLNKFEWETRSKRFYCQGNEEYHCFLMEDTLSRKEKCIQITTIADGNCPIFTTTGYLHWRPCNITGCPKERYRSNEVYKYPICYGNIDENTNGANRPDESNSGINLGLILGLGIGIPLILIVICFTSIFVIAKRKHKNSTTLEDGNPKNEEELTSLISEEKENDEFVDKGLTALVSGKLVYVVGKLGNGVSTTGKDIARAFAKTHKMEPCFYHYLDIPNEFPSDTVNYIDGWCGLWNYNPCEMPATKSKLKEITSSTASSFNVKFVVGIRTEVKQELEKHKIHFSENETVLLDTISKSKQDRIARKLESIQANCSFKGCKCKSIEIKDIIGISFKYIGTPLIVNLMDIDHRMIGGFLSEKNGPMKAMKNHMKNLQKYEKELFHCLLYIVVVGYYDQHELNDEFASEFELDKTRFENFAKLEKLQKYTKFIKKSKLASLWSAKISDNNSTQDKAVSDDQVLVFWHSVVYVCAFHVCFASYPEKLMRICNIDALLQLLRPTTWRPEPFTFAVKPALIDIFRKRINGTPYENKLSKHPLINPPEKKSHKPQKTN